MRISGLLWCHQESNRGHKDFQSFALPTELWHLLRMPFRVLRCKVTHVFLSHQIFRPLFLLFFVRCEHTNSYASTYQQFAYFIFLDYPQTALISNKDICATPASNRKGARHFTAGFRRQHHVIGIVIWKEVTTEMQAHSTARTTKKVRKNTQREPVVRGLLQAIPRRVREHRLLVEHHGKGGLTLPMGVNEALGTIDTASYTKKAACPAAVG